MAKKRELKKKSDDLIGDDFLEFEEAEELDGEIFAEAAGTPANKHAKALAKKASKDKKNAEPRSSFYTLKDSEKVIQVLVKHRGIYQIYVGNAKRHRLQIAELMKIWKKEGRWVEPHQVEETILKLRAALPEQRA